MACEHNTAMVCPCPHACASHGKCCECVRNHQNAGSLPVCFRKEPFVTKEWAEQIK